MRDFHPKVRSRLSGLGKMNLEEGAVPSTQQSKRIKSLAGSRATGPPRGCTRSESDYCNLSSSNCSLSNLGTLPRQVFAPCRAVHNIPGNDVIDSRRRWQPVALQADAPGNYIFSQPAMCYPIKAVLLQKRLQSFGCLSLIDRLTGALASRVRSMLLLPGKRHIAFKKLRTCPCIINLEVIHHRVHRKGQSRLKMVLGLLHDPPHRVLCFGFAGWVKDKAHSAPRHSP